MRLVIQRVLEASVAVDGVTVGQIDRGFLVLVGVTQADTPVDAEWLARKTVGLRVFEDDAGKMNLPLASINGACLVISQFTLYGDCMKGNRPSFVQAASPDLAAPLIHTYVEQLQKAGLRVEQGVFGADMKVRLLNDGPVTLQLESPAKD